ncbi:MAG TPA: Sec-independent protein translocase subunit TatA [Jatrophihabitans sp.]|jgi:sec-independent protein translocase protein TatA
MELFTPGHLLVLAIVVAVLFFGWKQLPDMARSLGRSLRIFKTEIKGMSEDDKKRAEAASNDATPGVPPAVEAPPAVPQVPAVPPADNQASTAPTGSNSSKPAQ